MLTRHYVNLTRGLLCPHGWVRSGPPSPRFVRIQSTWCEQKRWADILWTLDTDLLFNLALGNRVVVHDCSEKDRETRAMWQGLSWIRRACTLNWTALPAPEVSRSGHNLIGYWDSVYNELDDRVKARLDYFNQVRSKYRATINLESCWEG